MQVIYHSSVRTTFFPFGHPSPKKNSGYSIQYFMVHGTWTKNSIGTRFPPNKDIFSFPAAVLLWCMGLGKNQSHWTITEKNIFSFPTTVLLWCTGLGRFLIDTRPHRKKKKFQLQYWMCSELARNGNQYFTPTEKKLFVAIELLLSTGHRNYCSVLRNI